MCDDIFPDGVLLSGVEDIAQAALSEPTFLLLHMGGSHGPNYFQKYPKFFSTFDPVCTNKYLPMCDQEGLRNAYDNTLIYTDAVLAELSSILASIEGLNATILYTSDHGQSLGEDGIYAHAAPLSSAPKYQLRFHFSFGKATAQNARSQIPVLQRMMPFFTRSLGNLDLSMAASIARIGIYLRLKVINCGFASSRIASDDGEIKAAVYFFRSA
jgi:hypothetical protein